MTIDEILSGIDKTEIEAVDGWWETSAGAEFGARKLAEVKAAFSARPEEKRDIAAICELDGCCELRRPDGSR